MVLSQGSNDVMGILRGVDRKLAAEVRRTRGHKCGRYMEA
jgi:hypothetical protein